jgi:hypothetical protein
MQHSGHRAGSFRKIPPAMLRRSGPRIDFDQVPVSPIWVYNPAALVNGGSDGDETQCRLA